jgi:hypothetical protein
VHFHYLQTERQQVQYGAAEIGVKALPADAHQVASSSE